MPVVMSYDVAGSIFLSASSKLDHRALNDLECLSAIDLPGIGPGSGSISEDSQVILSNNVK